MQAVFAVAFKVPPRDAIGAGMKQPVWQFADCELHDIMQFVTVEVTGVESPWKGGVTFGVVGSPWKGGRGVFRVVACANATSCAPK